MISMKGLVAAASLVAVSGCANVPPGLVSHFANDTCPEGWTNASNDWQGRYLVVAGTTPRAMVGEALREGENRVTGDHGHGAGSVAVLNNCNSDDDCVPYADSGKWRTAPNHQVSSATPRGATETVRPGTNAPYVALRTCIKD